MSRLLEIFGKAIVVDTADLICDWLNTVGLHADDAGQFQQLREVVELVTENNLGLAEEKLKFYLFENPSCRRGRMAAAAVYLRNNQIPEAIEALQSVYLREPSNTVALYALGHCYERLGKEQEGLEFYQDCLKFKRYLQLPRQRLAAIYFKNNQIQKTIQEYESLVYEHPDDISSLVTLGHLFIADLRYDLAIDTFNNAILIHPDNFLLGPEDAAIHALIQSGQLREAADEIQWQLGQQADNADLNVKLADVLTMLGEDHEAMLHYERAIEIQPRFLEATIKLGVHHLRAQEYHQAAEYFGRATEINDRIVEAYIGLAIAQNCASKRDESYGTLSLASAIQQNSTLLFGEAAALQFRAVFEQAYRPEPVTDPNNLVHTVIHAHAKQVSQRPYNADIHYRYGLLLMGLARLNDAQKAFEKALELNPTYHRARCKLALCLYETSTTEHALNQLTTSAETLTEDILQLHYKMAILYGDKQKFARAIHNLKRSMQNNSAQHDDATSNISTVLQNLGLLDRVSVTLECLTETATHALSIPD